MGCIQSKDKGYSVPDLQSNEINNPMKETSSDKTGTSDTDKPLSPKELMMLKRSNSTCSNDEDRALLDRSPPPPTHRRASSPDTPTLDTDETITNLSSKTSSPTKIPPPIESPVSPKKSPKEDRNMEPKKLSVSELLMQEKMKKKMNGKTVSENEVS